MNGFRRLMILYAPDEGGGGSGAEPAAGGELAGGDGGEALPSDTAPTEGSGVAPGASGAGGAVGGDTASPYHSYGERNFASAAELNDFIRRGTMMHEDYSGKTRELSDQRKAHEQAVADFERQQKDTQGRVEWAQKVEQLYNSSPEVQDYLARAVGQPQSADQVTKQGQQYTSQEIKALRDEIMGEIEPLKEFSSGYQSERQLDQVLQEATRDDPDLADPVRERLAELSNHPNMLQEVAVLIARDVKAQRAAPGRNGGRPAGGAPSGGPPPRSAPPGTKRPPGNGSNPAPEAPVDHGSINAARKAAKQEFANRG